MNERAATEPPAGQVAERLAWLAAGIAVGASVLRGLAAADQHLHDWEPGALVVIVAAAQMLFAVLLVVGPGSGWSAGRGGNGAPDVAARAVAARALYLFGILGTATVLGLDLLVAPGGAHAPPASAADEAVSILDAIATVAQPALIVVLLALYVLAGRSAASSQSLDGEAGPS